MTTENWQTGTAADVVEGDTVKFGDGETLYVSRIENPFMGRAEMLAFIESTDARWYKSPVPLTAAVEYSRPS